MLRSPEELLESLHLGFSSFCIQNDYLPKSDFYETNNLDVYLNRVMNLVNSASVDDLQPINTWGICYELHYTLPYLEEYEYLTKYISLLTVVKYLSRQFYVEGTEEERHFNELVENSKLAFNNYEIPFRDIILNLLGNIDKTHVYQLRKMDLKDLSLSEAYERVQEIFPDGYVLFVGNERFYLIALFLKLFS